MRKNKGIWMLGIFALIACIIGLINFIPVGGLTMIIYGTFIKNYGMDKLMLIIFWFAGILISSYFVWRHKP